MSPPPKFTVPGSKPPSFSPIVVVEDAPPWDEEVEIVAAIPNTVDAHYKIDTEQVVKGIKTLDVKAYMAGRSPVPYVKNALSDVQEAFRLDHDPILQNVEVLLRTYLEGKGQ